VTLANICKDHVPELLLDLLNMHKSQCYNY